MKTIGLIGGMSWESTAVYYRRINEEIRRMRGGLASAEIAMRSLDFTTVVALQKADRWEDAGNLLGHAAASLNRAGAACVLICTNTMHLVSKPVADMAGVPLICIIEETAKALKADGRKRPLLLATRYTMEHGFYAERMAKLGIEIVTPDAEDRQIVHDVIFDELCQGKILDTSREKYLGIIEKMKSRGIDSVILGCTEISMLVDPDKLGIAGYDSTIIHADAAVRFALANDLEIAA
ncbi:aspartate/glutamate racemase family protein [Devosia sp. WQ 349]|uniref:aspartate/glutamate racemase family protein n=1 Tax=Devosia sp. WQ 349K1 TaxID=2800329 RepID=UPI001907F425|nr:aspartate/glutamate racemase family protein [Devosia sp. WQ 349K1]MBK1794863.1 aspartate/glutamate racemase family protein [Devosia sp. WQ 349K1]